VLLLLLLLLRRFLSTQLEKVLPDSSIAS